MTENLKERQEEEVDVLKSIYAEQIEDLRLKDPWKVWRPFEILIRLEPSRGLSGNLEVNCELKLHVKATSDYPKKCPEFAFQDVKGLSEKDQAFLMNKLRTDAAEHQNEVMLLDLCQMIEMFLHEKNQKISKLSFYEEMLQSRELKKRQESTDEQKMLIEEAAEIEAEIERRKTEAKEIRKGHLLDRKTSERESAVLSYQEEEEGEYGRVRSSSLPPKAHKLKECDPNVETKVIGQTDVAENVKAKEAEKELNGGCMDERVASDDDLPESIFNQGISECCKLYN